MKRLALALSLLFLVPLPLLAQSPDALSNDVRDLQSRLDDVESSIRDLQNRLTEVEDRLGNFRGSSTFDNVADRLEDIERDIHNLKR